jgi:hypothetical protein
LRSLSVSDGACVACCVFLSTGRYHVCIQIHATCCCFARCTTKAFGTQKSTLWGCKVGASESGRAWQEGQKASYSRFATTCLHPQGTPGSVHCRGHSLCSPVLGS